MLNKIKEKSGAIGPKIFKNNNNGNIICSGRFLFIFSKFLTKFLKSKNNT